MLVSSTHELEKFCSLMLRDRPESVAIDTEFVRSFSDYYPKLCLLQMAYGDKQCAIDVLEEGLDLTPIQAVFDDTNISKVFHDCRQDLEALSLRFDRLPKPIFDTQVAAMLCEYYDNAVGYSRLVEQFWGVKLDKLSFKRVDWSRRPISPSKVRYALDDVIYLHKLYGVLRDMLISKGRLAWFLEDMAVIEAVSGENYDAILEGMDSFGELTESEVLIARAVVEWRERVARLFNVNRNIVMNSKSVPCVVRDFLGVGNLGEGFLSKYVRDLYLRELPFSLSDIVQSNSGRKFGLYKLTEHDRPILNTLLVLLHSLCKEDMISQKLVASKVDLVKFINKVPSDITSGWRHEFFGNRVESFIEGKSKLTFSVRTVENHKELFVDTK